MKKNKLNQNRKIYRKSPNQIKSQNILYSFLHGYGADGSDLLSPSDYFQKLCLILNLLHLMHLLIVLCLHLEKEWFPIEKIPFGAVEAAKHFLEFLEIESKFYSVTFNNIYLIGFSQGAMLSLQIMLLSEKNWWCSIFFRSLR